MKRNAAIATLVAPLAAGAIPATAQGLTPVKVALNLSTYSNLPFFLAADKGYFRAAGLDLQVQSFSTSSTAQMPLLARGDVDLMPLALGPAFFNGFSEGFDVKLVASLSSPRRGWNDTTWLVVRQDLWDAKAIRTLKDLRGKSIDGVAPGSPIDFLALTAVAAAGLGQTDVTYTNKFRDAPSWISALRNKAVDVQGVPEPVATQVETQKLGHKWLGMSTLAPWFHESFVAVSANFARNHPNEIVAFLRALLRANREIDAGNGKWTPDLVASEVKWTQQTESVIQAIPGPAYPGNGNVDMDSVARQQAVWHKRGLVATITPVDKFVDTESIRRATSGK